MKGPKPNLPAPLVPVDVDLRGVPLPREFFAQMAVLEFGVPIGKARSFVDEMADKIEGKRRPRRGRL